MEYYSTNNKLSKVSLKEAVVKGLASDNGLYMPEKIEKFEASFQFINNDYNIDGIGLNWLFNRVELTEKIKL